MIKEISKRDGSVAEFNRQKIVIAISKAFKACKQPLNELPEKLTDQLISKVADKERISVEEIQDLVEKTLIDNGLAVIAKRYILYRKERTQERDAKEYIYGVKDDLKMSLNAIKVLKERYLIKDDFGMVVETPKGMFRRVAKAISLADGLFNMNADTKKTEEKFFNTLVNFEFLPNSPTLMNAGRRMGQLSACFVLPVEDSLDSIFDAVKDSAHIFQTGGGVGFAFSRLRPKGDIIKSTGGFTSGTISFMDIYNSVVETMKSGGKRRGAMMGVLRVDHPDIEDFIFAKKDPSRLVNFNISVGLTDKFMEALKNNENYELLNPRSSSVVRRVSADRIFDHICTMAHMNGEPGLLYMDVINKYNPTPEIGEIESTNPCGEVPLLPYESCNLGSIILPNMIRNGQIDWDKLRETVRTAVHFLDNVVEVNRYPISKIRQMTLNNRKIGLGIMGFADMLIKLEIPYNSEEGLEIAEKVMKFINEEGRKKSVELGEERGSFPNFDKSIFKEKYPALRHATITTIAPTGSIGLIANTSSGIEPLFAVSFVRNILGGTQMVERNKLFEEIAKREGFFTEQLMMKIALMGGRLNGIDEVPDKYKKIFVTAHEVSPEWHVRMQAAFQKYVDNAVSKTVNLSNSATIDDVKKIYLLAYDLGCKGITIYRDGSRFGQVLSTNETSKGKKGNANCEECGV